MKAPQIVVLLRWAVILLFSAHRHGKPQKGLNSFWVDLWACAIMAGLLVWGGFFK